MDPIQLMVTTAGLDALVNAQSGATDPIQVVSVGITGNAFVMAPTITAVPGELKRLDAISGQSISDTVIHMTAQDSSTDIYDLRGLGLYLADGTLFAVYSQPDPLFRKVSIAFFLLALDIAFASGGAGDIVFGDTSFLLPPASETVKGVAEVATPGEAAAGIDHERIITPLTLKMLLDALETSVGEDLTALADGFDDLLAALVARTITGGGLISGGGDLSGNRILSVIAASAADVATGSANDRAVTPAALAGSPRYLGQSGNLVLPGGGGLMLAWGRFVGAANASTAVTFWDSFPSACFIVLAGGVGEMGAGSQDNPVEVLTNTITASGFSVFSADDASANCSYFALGI